jgi:methyl-accepting chemotaxis protein
LTEVEPLFHNVHFAEYPPKAWFDSGEIAMNDAKTYRRKQYLINPSFQWKIAGTIAIAVFLFTVLISITLYGTLHQQARLRAADPMGYTAEVTSIMICFGLGFAAITAGGVGLWSILMTHRICGPMFVMKRYMLELAEGRLPSLRPLRKRDEFKDLYDAFDLAISALRSAKQRELMQLNTAMDAIRQSQTGDTAATRQAIQTVMDRIEGLRVKAQEALAESKPQTTESQACGAMKPAAQPV